MARNGEIRGQKSQKTKPERPERPEKPERPERPERQRKTTSSGSNVGFFKKDVCVDFRDSNVQVVMVLGLLAIMVLALWYGFTQGCFRPSPALEEVRPPERERRRTGSSRGNLIVVRCRDNEG
ncbi:uncharacterized protein LOC113233269 isoform X2 [Hyposmocoma kahamanoa]|uniref:uncharacterized protein LOC113233269 isoform X2 n=1 Tax=Hyposmocoma kahamanoa TaxID=1477025 RepID=UPI000E6D8BB2|nr:uncharacterized protein LOC113233269 isoform X2 [Hyposmocoma kahamanoa]